MKRALMTLSGLLDPIICKRKTYIGFHHFADANEVKCGSVCTTTSEAHL
jgi:hypothetical protein